MHRPHYLLLSILFLGLLLPSSKPTAAQAIQVVVEAPALSPPFNNDCPTSYWFPFLNNRGYTAYLTLNADALNSTNHGEWHPVIPQAGYYRVEAYIAQHAPITWCSGNPSNLHDTTKAHYGIRHAFGETSRTVSQYPHSNEWLYLGEYYFNAGTSGYVYLSDLNEEKKFSTTVSFSAMRFISTRPAVPKAFLPFVEHTSLSPKPPANTGIIQAQGFDSCSLPMVSQMQVWWNQSPYSFYALYIGGIHLPSGCARADSTWVSAVHQQGWSFVPTWVGPQAPCTTYKYRMSMDPATAYQEGRQEAQAASAVAASLGLTNYGMGGTIIYYDLEAYGVLSSECRQPVSAFMNGWTERLHELGNFAGAYGARNSYVSDWANIQHVPNDAWLASITASAYDPNASVYGIPWIPGLWTDHQRIRQYTVGHTEYWGGLKHTLDSDVADGMVAMPSTLPKPGNIPLLVSSPPVEDTGWLSADQGWLISQNRLYWTVNQGDHWQDISPGLVQLAYFLPSGQAWAVSTRNATGVTLLHSSNWGADWESSEIDLPPDAWYPLQLQFNSPSSGWIVLQKETSQAFDIGILLKTEDGGRTWHSYALPAAGAITFVSPTDGWMSSRTQDKLFHTLDGGLTWSPVHQEQYPNSQLSLPENATLSGGQAGGLGWAVTSTGTCEGDKSTTGFACQVDNTLWQTQDGGQTWQSIPLPTPDLPLP